MLRGFLAAEALEGKNANRVIASYRAQAKQWKKNVQGGAVALAVLLSLAVTNVVTGWLPWILTAILVVLSAFVALNYFPGGIPGYRRRVAMLHALEEHLDLQKTRV